MSDNNQEAVAVVKSAAIVSMVAETHIHAGIGQSIGALDLPVARERTTYYPFVPGSGIKGAFRVWAKERAELTNKQIAELFGPDTQSKDDKGGDLYAGSLLCSDARLLLLPVRCLSDAYKWVTCPAILNRFQRDCKRAGVLCGNLKVDDLNAQKYLGAEVEGSWLGLEEREFQRQGDPPGPVVAALEKLVGSELEPFLAKRLVILSDKDFTWFARYALPVMTRNALDENKIVVGGALWHEETLAPDTVMYVLFGERKPEAVQTMIGAIKDNARYIQIGGNETVGQGWFALAELSEVNGGGGNGE